MDSLPLHRDSFASIHIHAMPASATASPAMRAAFTTPNESPASMVAYAPIAASATIVSPDAARDLPLSALSLATSAEKGVSSPLHQEQRSQNERALCPPSTPSAEFLSPISEDVHEPVAVHVADAKNAELVDFNVPAKPLPSPTIVGLGDRSSGHNSGRSEGHTPGADLNQLVRGSQASQHRHKQAQKKLKRAIENNNTRTVNRLKYYNYLAGAIIIISIFLVLVDFFLTDRDLSHTELLLDNIYYSSLRQSQAVYIGANFYLLFLFLHFPGATNLNEVFYRPLVHADNSAATIVNVATVRVGALLKAYAKNAAIVDAMPTRSAKRHALRTTNSISLLMRTPTTPEKYAHFSMSLPDLVSHISSLAAYSLYEGKANVVDDPGFFFVVANTVSQATTKAFELDTILTVEEIEENLATMVDVTVIMFIITLITVIIIAAALLLPLVVRVERSKATVLDILLSVPQNVRKALRRKAVRVYRLVEKVENGESSMRAVDDDDNENDEPQKGPASTIGSEATSISFTQSAVSGSPAEDAFTSLFKRYNNFRNMNEGFSSEEDGNDVEGKHSAHRNRLGRADNAIRSARSHVDDGDMQEGQVQGDGLGVDAESLFSGFSGNTATAAENAAMERKQSKSRYNVWTGSAVRLATLRFSVFTILICVYFAILILQSQTFVHDMHNAVQRVSLGNLRNPRIILAFDYLMAHLFSTKAELDPLNPNFHSPRDFHIEGLDRINQAEETFFGVVFGDAKFDISGRVEDPRQKQLVFDNICEIDPEEMFKVYPDGRAVKHLFAQCSVAQNGINTRGLYSSFFFLHEHYKILLNPANSKAFAHYLTGDAPKFDAETTRSLKVSFDVTYQFFNDFMYHHLVYSGALYKQMAMEQIYAFTDFRHLLIGISAALIFVSYFVLIRPTTLILAKTSSQANSMVLLIDPRILQIVPAAQKFVQDNLTAD